MESNYYTPTIDEFCLGFEFEYFVRSFNEDNEYVDSEWVPSKVILSESNKAGTTHLDLQDIKLSYYQLGLALANKTIRVKVLDFNDIYSLGCKKPIYMDEDYVRGSYCFTLENMQANLFAYPYAHEINNINYKTEVRYLEIDTTVSQEYSTSHRFIGQFQGIIKNKTELKKLLKQLNIEFNDN